MIAITVGFPGAGMSYQTYEHVRYGYAPYHACPVCGNPVFNVPPFADDCKSCRAWFSLFVSGGEK